MENKDWREVIAIAHLEIAGFAMGLVFKKNVPGEAMKDFNNFVVEKRDEIIKEMEAIMEEEKRRSYENGVKDGMEGKVFEKVYIETELELCDWLKDEEDEEIRDMVNRRRTEVIRFMDELKRKKLEKLNK